MESSQVPEDAGAAVAALGVRARRLSWGYFAYVAYYVSVGSLFVYHGVGVRWAGLGPLAASVLRLMEILVPLFVYVAVNAGLGIGLRYLLQLHPAARWGLAVLAVLLAAAVAGLYGVGLWRWYEAGFPPAHFFRQGLGLLLASGYVFLAFSVLRLVRAVERFVLIEGVWLPKVHPDGAGARVIDL